jgi:F0F1-type ATP synthase gamma subunit
MRCDLCTRHPAAIQRAGKNIDALLEDLNRTFHRLRQSGIDEELFDVVSGFEALARWKTCIRVHESCPSSRPERA